ncbi:MAG: hypothetical protein ACR2IQ_00990 [Minisyncoccia bacterium]
MASGTQDFVPIKEIRNGVIELTSGEVRAIILANPINLSLKTEDEQQAILANFMSFLNSLDFSTQISIQSRRLDITEYLLKLEKRYELQTEPLLKIQTRQYIEFIRDFTENNEIMTKDFFVVVPYEGGLITKEAKGLMSFFSGKSKKETLLDEQKIFEENRTQLEQRVSLVISGLASCGVQAQMLDTDSVIEVVYKVFNPGDRNRALATNNENEV